MVLSYNTKVSRIQFLDIIWETRLGRICIAYWVNKISYLFHQQSTLYKYTNCFEITKKYSQDCEHQVERVLRQRARSVMLKPEMERACRGFLHMHCASHIRPGEEMKCLQVK